MHGDHDAILGREADALGDLQHILARQQPEREVLVQPSQCDLRTASGVSHWHASAQCVAWLPLDLQHLLMLHAEPYCGCSGVVHRLKNR